MNECSLPHQERNSANPGGDKLGYSASLVSGIETMDKAPTADFAQRCGTTFQTSGTFATMRVLVAREVWPSYFALVIELEATAIRIPEWEMRVVPGVASGDHPGTDGRSWSTTSSAPRPWHMPSAKAAAGS